MVYVSQDGFFRFTLDVHARQVTNAGGQTFTMHDFTVVGYDVLKGPYEGWSSGGEGYPFGVDPYPYEKEIQEYLDNQTVGA